MALSVKHAFTSSKADGADATLVQPSNWNAEHTMTAAINKVLGTDGSSTTIQELSCTSAGRSMIAAADAVAQIALLVPPINSKSTDYTFVLGDANQEFLHPSADTTARTWTIPANASVAYPQGTILFFRNLNGAGVITIAITSDTMRLAGAGTTGSRFLAANGFAAARKVSASEWQISGVGLT